MANTENIEAKLCAYVDGELDPAGRAEIEGHLASNPQHRQLMDELMKQRKLLAGLPRERAPEDLFEAMTNQLERSVLLDGDAAHAGVTGVGGAGPHIAGQINRWPQVFAAAAVLVLAIGLAAVIYFVLPDQSRPAYVTSTTPASAMRGEAAPSVVGGDPDTRPTALARREVDRNEAKVDAAKAAPGEESLAGRDAGAAPASPAAPATPEPPPAAVAVAPAANDIFSKAAERPDAAATVMGKGGFVGVNRDNIYTNVFADPQQLNEKLKSAPGVPDNSMLVVVNAGDPSATNQQIREYFVNNGIAWQPVVEPMPEPLDLRRSQTVSGSRLGNTQMRLKGGSDDGTAGGGFGGGAGGAGQQAAPAPAQAPADADVKEQREAIAQADVAQRDLKGATEQDKLSADGFKQMARSAPSPTGATTPGDDAAANAGTEAAQLRDAGNLGVASGSAAAPSREAQAKTSAPDSIAQSKSGTLEEFARREQAALPPAATADQSQSAQAQPQVQSQAAAPPVAQQQQPALYGEQQLQQQQFGAPSQTQVFIARGLTKQQVLAMNSAIATGNRIDNYNRAGDTITPTTLPAAGDTLNLQSPFPSRPAAEAPVGLAKKETEAARGYAPTLETPSTMPSAGAPGSIAIAGGAAAATTRPATVPHDENSAFFEQPDAPVAAAPAAPGAPASVATNKGAASAMRQRLTTAPATKQVVAASQPSPTDDEDLVDVVILVQPETDPGLQQQRLDQLAPNASSLDAPAAATTTNTATAPAATTTPAP
jgi:hypothetical protein